MLKRAPAFWMMAAMLTGMPVTRACADLKPGQAFRDCDAGCPAMVVIAAGKFRMGLAPNETGFDKLSVMERRTHAPQHDVVIGQEFALGEFDVTRAEFAMFLKLSGYRLRGECEQNLNALSRSSWQNPGFSQTENDPVVCVSWADAHAYAGWLSGKAHRHYRLPSEAEWEFAARSGTAGARYWGNDSAQVCRYANVSDRTLGQKYHDRGDYFDCSDGYAFTSPVGAFPKNSFGLYDMLGNVNQLVEDCWHWSFDGAPANGLAWTSGDCLTRVMRGPAFNERPVFVRASLRQFVLPDAKSAFAGFRVAADIRN